MHVALHLRGGLDRAALSQALQSLVERQPALRTRFEMRREELWQVILEQVDLPLETISDLPEAADAAARR